MNKIINDIELQEAEQRLANHEQDLKDINSRDLSKLSEVAKQRHEATRRIIENLILSHKRRIAEYKG